MERISWFSAEAMGILTVFLACSYLLYSKCQEWNDPMNRIPTRRQEIIAESSIVLEAHDLEMRKMEYIKRKRGQKYPPTSNHMEGMETLP